MDNPICIPAELALHTKGEGGNTNKAELGRLIRRPVKEITESSKPVAWDCVR